jgi:hypothetical protein
VLSTLSSHARNFKKNSTPASRNSFARFLTNDAVVPSENYVALISFLLRRPLPGLERQKVVSTAWIQALRLTTKLVGYSRGFWNSFAEEELVLWAKLLEEFILLGADVNATIELAARGGAHRQSASLVIMILFKQLPPQAISMRSITASRDSLKKLLEARGAIKTEWLNGKLTLGAEKPPSSTMASSSEASISVSKSSTGKGFRDRLRSLRRRRDGSASDHRSVL